MYYKIISGAVLHIKDIGGSDTVVTVCACSIYPLTQEMGSSHSFGTYLQTTSEINELCDGCWFVGKARITYNFQFSSRKQNHVVQSHKHLSKLFKDFENQVHMFLHLANDLLKQHFLFQIYFYFKFITFYILCTFLWPACIHVHHLPTWCPHRALGPSNWNLIVIVTSMWMLGIQSRSSERAVSALNC